MKQEVKDFVGKKAMISFKGFENFKVEVEIVDVHNTYGRTRYEVKPVRGSGLARVEKVELIK